MSVYFLFVRVAFLLYFNAYWNRTHTVLFHAGAGLRSFVDQGKEAIVSCLCVAG